MSYLWSFSQASITADAFHNMQRDKVAGEDMDHKTWFNSRNQC